MTTEQKAKAYDEVIERVNSKWRHKNHPCFIDIAKIFPELKESDDESIRKAIVTLIEDLQHYSTNYAGVDPTDMLAWIEKQKEQPHWKPSEEQMEALLNAEGLLRKYRHIAIASKLAELYEELKKLM